MLIFIRGNNMNKKIIMLISALVCINSMTFPPRPALSPFELGDEIKYRNLVNKFRFNELALTDNTTYNISILEERKHYLVSAIAVKNKLILWPYALVASVGPMLTMVSWAGNVLNNQFFKQLALLPNMINQALGFSSNVMPKLIPIIASSVPLYVIYFSGMYDKYVIGSRLLQELHEIEDILAELHKFGKPIDNGIVKISTFQKQI